MSEALALAKSLPSLAAFSQTRRLIVRIYVHTAASVDVTVNAAEIRRWHVKGNGWRDIGYHAVVTHDHCPKLGADITWCRSEATVGAGVKGDNTRTLHVCVTGHGDKMPHTVRQRAQLLRVLARWCRCYRVRPDHVLGHRESYKVREAIRVSKTCPGLLVDMDEIRSQLTELLSVGHIPFA